jgi:lysozyme
MINDRGMNLIKSFEGLKLRAYLDTLAKPPVWTIGYGETGEHVVEGLVWTFPQAEEALARRVEEFAELVLAECTIPPNENQLAAMTSLTYNIGIGPKVMKKGMRPGFRQSSVLRLHNEGRFAEAASAFAMWNKAGGQVRAGLTRRRSAESSLYLLPISSEKQTTRATPDAPAAGSSKAAAVAGAGAALTVAQQAVGQVSSIWDGLSGIGISPHILMAALGVAAAAAIAWFAWDAYKNRGLA